MKFGKILTSIAAAGLVAAPAIAQASTTAAAAMPSRASASVDGKHKASGGTYVLAALGVAAAAGGIYAATKSHHDNKSDGAQ